MINMTLAEDTIKQKYGNTGLKIFSFIDGHRNAEEIMKNMGIKESLLIEILSFMESKGLIKMKYPEYKQNKINVSLPQNLQEKMHMHNVDWNDVIPKLVSLYLDSLEKAEANIELLKMLNISNKKQKILKKKIVKSRTKKKAKDNINTPSAKCSLQM